MNEKKKTDNRYLFYILFLVILVGAVMIYFKMRREYQEQNPQTTDLAIEPDLLITSADRYLHDHKRLTSIKFLEEAIDLMELFKENGDSMSIKTIDVAIHDLKAIEKHIKAEDINDELMYEAFADAMNSLALASLKISEEYVKQGKEYEANKAFEYAMEHLQNSIKYAKGEQKAEEMKIVAQLNNLIEAHLENDISEIDEVMVKIDSVIKAHVIE